MIREKMNADQSRLIPPEVLKLINDLTKRQKEVLVLALKGLAAKDISDKLCISLNTVNSHITAIRQTFHLTFNGSLMQFAIDNGLFIWLKSQE
jgi:DNA-binding NarL/FixJ family response regulator